MSKYAKFVVGVAVALGSPFAVADDTMRCGGALVRAGMIAPEIVAKCGEPKDKVVEEVPVRVRTRAGGVNNVGVTRVERWTYDRGYGQFPAVLTFEEGKLKSLELVTGK